MLQYKVKGKETHTMLKKILITLFVIILSGSVFAHEYKLGTLEIDHPYTPFFLVDHQDSNNRLEADF